MRKGKKMEKMNLELGDFLTLVGPAQMIEVVNEDNEELFVGKAAKAKREEQLTKKYVKFISFEPKPSMEKEEAFKIWLYE